jgi:DNA repair protein RadA/Sms
MAKPTKIYVCDECEGEFPKWQGRCSRCGAWNSMVEKIEGDEESTSTSSSSLDSGKTGYAAQTGNDPSYMSDIDEDNYQRVETHFDELNRVLGGGFVPGGVVLLGGDPGIGKSTLSLQVAGMFASEGSEVLYISGEESASQLKMRASRLDIDSDDILVLCETSLERAEAKINEAEPDFVVVDSIQSIASEELTSSPGNVAQLREVTGSLTQLAKGTQIPIVLIGHVTKQGAIAGPKVLEHMVDTVLYFEGREGGNHRILRAVKNRYGSTNEIGIFEWEEGGLSQVFNPSEVFLTDYLPDASGSAVVATVEGTRPLLVEVQALVSANAYGPPSVTTVGVDRNRVVLLLNIIEKRTGLEITGHDVFVKVAGGMKLEEPATDLAVGAAILSSYFDEALPSGTVAVGEVGLTGEVRPVSKIATRMAEVEKLGFDEAIVPAPSKEEIQTEWDSAPEIDIFYGQNLAKVIQHLFGEDIFR